MFKFSKTVNFLFVLTVLHQYEISTVSSSCVYPSQPANGKYTRKTSVGLSSIAQEDAIIVNECNADYTLHPRTSVLLVCENGDWDKEIPQCLSACPPRKSDRVELECKFNKNTVPCDKAMPHGTIVKMKCKAPYKAQGSWNPQSKCLNSRWDFNLLRCELDPSVTPVTPATQDNTIIRNGCKLPQQPNFGKYVNDDDIDAVLIPSETVPENTMLFYECNDNYRLQPSENDLIECRRRKWAPQIPTCIQSLTTKSLCQRTSPNLNGCLLSAMRRALPQIVDGVPEYNIAPLDPLDADFIEHVQLNAVLININMNLKNIVIRGYRNTQFRKFKLNPAAMNGEVQFYIPQLNLTLEYDAYGSILYLPVDSKAYMHAVCDDLDFSVKFRLRIVPYKGVDYYTVDQLLLRVAFGKTTLKLTSVEPSQQGKDNTVQNFFNTHHQHILGALNGEIRREAQEFYRDLIERYLSVIAADDLLPE